MKAHIGDVKKSPSPLTGKCRFCNQRIAPVERIGWMSEGIEAQCLVCEARTCMRCCWLHGVRCADGACA